MNHTIQQLGFVTPVHEPDHYVFGGELVPRTVLQPSANWTLFLPVGERQETDIFDTSGCTVFGTLNAIEILFNRIKNANANFSDRFTYITSGTQPPGNDPHVVAETIRTVGVVDEEKLPFSTDIDSLQKFMQMTDEKTLRQLGLEWLSYFDMKHEWVFMPNTSLSQKQKLLIECLTLSPLGVSVRAWQQRENGLYYKEIGEQDTHWCVCIGYEIGKYWIIFDSYPQSEGDYIKHLEWDYDFGFAKRYYLSSQLVPIVKKKENLLQIIINWLTNLIQLWTAQLSTP